MTIQAMMLQSGVSVPPFDPVTRLYTTPGSGAETVPSGATTVVIECIGSGQNGAAGLDDVTGGDGGKAAGYCKSSYSCTGGQTLSYTVAASPGGQTSLTNGNSSTVSSGTLSITTMDAKGGNAGSPSGGNVANTAGGAGSGAVGGLGGAGGTNSAWTYGTHGSGGQGGNAAPFPSGRLPQSGLDGAVRFYYT